MVSATLSDKGFKKLVSERARTLLGLARHVSQCQSRDELITRPLMGALLSQSTQIEEFLDAFGAGNNCRWCGLRSLTAAIKHFSDVTYELLHIRYGLPEYHLLPIKQDFLKATNETIDFTIDILVQVAEKLIAKATELDLPIPEKTSREQNYVEKLPAGRLERDCVTRRVETVSESATRLATAFLHLAVESKYVRAAGQAKPEEYVSYASDSLGEEKLRSLELQFHNLQALYDTYVSGTEAEQLDTDLPVLRGHISVVFHLLRTATLFGHHYERHVKRQSCGSPGQQPALVKADALLDVLMKYSVAHINLYIGCAEQLCHEMLQRYAEIGQIEVGVPPYRGFHVRPSTLISKLALHYGSELQMELDDEVYDASSPLELFRANEKINARKRRWLCEEIVRLGLVQEGWGQKDTKIVVRDVVLALAGRSNLILYEQPLKLPEQPAQKEGKLLEKVIDEMARLLAMGKIDVDAQLTARFIGDKRVLEAIKLLAESGYGEDQFGNNVALPEKLAYLRR